MYRPGFLSPEEEAEVRSRARELPFREFRMRGFVAKRQVAYFGRDYAYDAREVRAGPPFPPFLLRLRARAAALAAIPPAVIEMAAVLRYPPGAAIGWHRDAPAFGIVVGLSLGAPARLQLREGGAGGERRELVLEPGSAYVLSGAARWSWQHRIPPLRGERYAITFRTMRRGRGGAAEGAAATR